MVTEVRGCVPRPACRDAAGGLASILGAPLRLQRTPPSAFEPAEWFGARRGRRRPTYHGNSRDAGPDGAVRGSGSLSQGISLSAQQECSVGLSLEALAFYLPRSTQRPQCSSWTSHCAPLFSNLSTEATATGSLIGLRPGLRAWRPGLPPAALLGGGGALLTMGCL